MYALRTIVGTEDLNLPGAPSIEGARATLLGRGATRPEWCFRLARDGVDVGRMGLYVEPTCPPEFLGRLPPREAFVFGLWLPWQDDDWLEAGRLLVGGALERARPGLPERAQAIVNLETHDHADRRRRVFEAAGMALFQEKQGFVWRGDGAKASGPGRLTFRTIDDVGRELYRDTIARVGEGTLDRNDAWYRELAGPQNWANVFLSFMGPSDAPGWLLASLPGGEPVGMVAVSPFDEQTATIVFIGVVPEHRGKGYVDELVRASGAAARRAGFGAMLSDADVLNTPMTSAFERNGHRPGVRPWHKWHYRL